LAHSAVVDFSLVLLLSVICLLTREARFTWRCHTSRPRTLNCITGANRPCAMNQPRLFARARKVERVIRTAASCLHVSGCAFCYSNSRREQRRSCDALKASARTKVFARLFQKAAEVRGEEPRRSSGGAGRGAPQVERVEGGVPQVERVEGGAPQVERGCGARSPAGRACRGRSPALLPRLSGKAGRRARADEPWRALSGAHG